MEPVENFRILNPSQKERVQSAYHKERELPNMQSLRVQCAPGVIKVRKFIEGKIAY